MLDNHLFEVFDGAYAVVDLGNWIALENSGSCS